MCATANALYDFFQAKLDTVKSEYSTNSSDDSTSSKSLHNVSDHLLRQPPTKMQLTVSKSFPLTATPRQHVKRQHSCDLEQRGYNPTSAKPEVARRPYSKHHLSPTLYRRGLSVDVYTKSLSDTNIGFLKNAESKNTFEGESGQCSAGRPKTGTRLSSSISVDEMNLKFGDLNLLSSRTSIHPAADGVSDDEVEKKAEEKSKPRVAKFFRKIYKKLKKDKKVTEEFPAYKLDRKAMTNADPCSQSALTLEHLVIQTPYGFSTLKSRPMTMCSEAMFH